MKARLVRPLEAAPSHPDYVPGKKTWIPIGTVLEHPQAYLLVRNGVATAEDDECKVAARMTEGKWQRAYESYEPFSRGIAPEDYEDYEAGLIDGYIDGEPIPGPASEDYE